MIKENKTLIFVTGTSSGIGKELKLLLVKDNKFDFQVFHSRVRSKDFIDNNQNKHIFGDLENFSNMWLDSINFNNFSTIVYVNNAAIIDPINKFENISINDLKKSINVNLVANAELVHYLINQMQKKTKLIIYNISSGASSKPIEGWSAYCSTKSATKMMLDVISLENSNVLVHHHDPGMVDTNMQKKIRSTNKYKMKNVAFFREAKLTEPEDAAKKIVADVCQLLNF